MSNSDIDYIEKQLKGTTQGCNNIWPPPKSHTNWWNAYVSLESLRVSTPPPTDTRKHFTGGNLDSFLVSLKPGDNAVMDIGGTLNSSINFGGTAAAPIKLDLNGKVVDGRLDMRGSAVWWEIYNGGLRDLQPQGPGHYQSWVIGGSDIKFHDLDCINGHTKIGWQTIDDSTYGSSHRVEFRNMRVHNIGTPSTAAFDDNQEHGFYDVAYSGHYIDCLVYDCAARAFQLRAAKSAHVEYCTWSGCGQGVLFGDLGATNCIVENFIGVNNVELSRYLVEEFDPSHNDSANLVRNGYAWNSDGRQAVQDNMAGVAVSNVFKANPQLGADYKPASGSPAAIYGCRTIPPTFF